MRLAALFSGGKDSTYAIWKAIQEGHEIAYLCTIHSKNPDSYMYDTSNIGLSVMQAEALDIRLVSKESEGEKEKEVHDMEILLQNLDIEGVICGALASNYQKKRVEKVCKKLKLKLVTPLWHTDLEGYLRSLVKEGFEVVFTKVQAAGLTKKWLGRKLDEAAIGELVELEKKHKLSIVGEGGEFDTKVLDCPLFKRKLVITQTEVVWDEKTGSGQLIIKDAKFADKPGITPAAPAKGGNVRAPPTIGGKGIAG
jgi:ABC transporter with metal-binding/Fe-S-binding domain ATP-binding protein